jgi:hypothetical protein
VVEAGRRKVRRKTTEREISIARDGIIIKIIDEGEDRDGTVEAS